MSEMAMRPDSQGKVRDLYDLGDKLLIVATDRISAFDYILKDEIPYKGEVLTRPFALLVRLACGHHSQPSDFRGRGRSAREIQTLCRVAERPLHAQCCKA